MVSLGSGYFHPDSSSSSQAGGSRGANSQPRYYPIFKHTTPKLAVSSRAGSEADDEATTTVSAPSSSSSSDPSAKGGGGEKPPVAVVRSRNMPLASTCGETSSISTNTAISIVAERELFHIFTDEDDGTSIGDGRVGESFSSTTCSSPIPWSEIKLTAFGSKKDTKKDTSRLSSFHSSPKKDKVVSPSQREGSSSSSSSISHAERGRQLARVLLDQARSKQMTTNKRRRVSFARAIRLGSDVGSSSSTTSSSSDDNKDDTNMDEPAHRLLASRHVLSKRNKIRASLLRRAVQSLRSRKDFVDKLFEIPVDQEVEKKQDEFPTTDSHYFPSVSAVTARNKNFAEWEMYLRVPRVAPPSTSNAQSPQHHYQQQQQWKNSPGLPSSPPRMTKSSSSTPQPSPSRLSVTSVSSWSFKDHARDMPFTSSNNLKRKKPTSDVDDDDDDDRWLLEGLSSRTSRETMLNHLGILPRDDVKSNNNPSQLSREAVLKTLETLDSLWNDDDVESKAVAKGRTPAVPPPRSTARLVQKEYGPVPTVSILGVVLVNYPQMVCDQVNYFRRNVLHISDACHAAWAAATTATTTSSTSTAGAHVHRQ